MKRLPRKDHDPLRVMFLITSMETGGAEILLVNLIRNLDRSRIAPILVCLKQPGELGETLRGEVPLYSDLIRHKLDGRVIGRLGRLMKDERIDALVTVGAGDKMFWGRLAARRAGVPVIISALHSTGWPDSVGRLNRCLTPITDAFVAVAAPHRQHLIRAEKFPADKVRLVPNGVDTSRFQRSAERRAAWRRTWQIPEIAPVCGIVAALRPEKNHELFLSAAQAVGQQIRDCHFLVVGDGVRRYELESLASRLDCANRIHFCGTTRDIPGALSAMDLFSLTSHIEASPVSILEAMSCLLPVVAPRVGSIECAVIDNETGFLFSPGDQSSLVSHWLNLLGNPQRARQMGQAGRTHVLQYGSLQVMTSGYMDLIENLYASKMSPGCRLAPPTIVSSTAATETPPR